MTNTTTNTTNLIAALRDRRIDDATRALSTDGARLTHDEADDLGAEAIEWVATRLGLRIETDDAGVTLAPRE